MEEELFTRVGMDRYTKVTGDDGNTYYVYNEEDENDSTTLYSLNNISINKELRKQITLMPYKNQNGTDYPLGEKLMSLWNDKEMTLNPYDKKAVSLAAKKATIKTRKMSARIGRSISIKIFIILRLQEFLYNERLQF